MNSKDGFKDKVVVITGASSGIGREATLEFAREGAKTALLSRSAERLEKVAGEIAAIDSEALVVPADVSAPGEVKEAIRKVVSEFGRVDILFNNAGSSFAGSIEDDDFIEKTKKLIDVDYFGTVRMTREVLPVMKKQGSGHIINMSSVVGRKAFPRFGGYSSVMHAVTAFSDALRQELRGSGINVSTIHPGLTQTPLLNDVRPEDMPPPFRRMTPISPQQVAKALLNGIEHNQARIVVPFQPNFLLLADALSPGLGDMVVRMLSNRLASRLLGTYRGRVYNHGH